MKKFTLAIHGGASSLDPKKLEGDYRLEFDAGLRDALKAGYDVLAKEGTAIDAVTAAICSLENHPIFNAAHGGVLCNDEQIRLSASIMDGYDRTAGAVMGLQTIKNPITAVKAMLPEAVVCLFGEDAEKFSLSKSCESVDPSYFMTERSRNSWLKLRQGEGNTGAHTFIENPGNTVGAVALDCHGNIAAGTSTGGLTNQPPGRVSDTAVIGGGTWAENNTCAISATGDGEAFIRTAFARRVADLVELKNMSLQEAIEFTLLEVEKAEGYGGAVAVDAKGNVALPFSSPQMSRGWISNDGLAHYAIFPDEDLTEQF
ncbi:MAG: isoaspartyl peptidase/L-asparaginase [Lentisphaeraceae bacterium]|nr:isoaspartyl peptidase/L-asparaginase [Lentisphaeraceae bacterium]